MQLEDLYRRLSVGHLSNLSIGMEGAGDLTAKGKTAAKVHFNTALRKLAKRFTLAERAIVIQLLVGQTRYPLKPEHALSNMPVDGDPADFFIIDTDQDPFDDEVLKVLRVYTDQGTELHLNQPDEEQSLYTPSHSLLQVPTDLGVAMLAVSYRTYLDAVPADAADDYEVDIPTVLEDPIVHFIAAQMFGNMNGPEHLQRSQMLMQSYEEELTVIMNEDLLGDSSIHFHEKLTERGFV